MDGRTRYSRLAEGIKTFSQKEITINDLRSMIMMNIGSDERTIISCMKVMAETGLIKDIGNSRFEINEKQ